MVAARGGSRSVGLAPSLASPPAPSGTPPPRSPACGGVCARAGAGVGGAGAGAAAPGTAAEGGAGGEGLRGAMDVERLQEALKGGGRRAAGRAPGRRPPASPRGPRAGLCVGRGSGGRGAPGTGAASSCGGGGGLWAWGAPLALTTPGPRLGEQQAREHCFPNLKLRGPGVLRTPF